MRLLHTSDWHLGRSFHREGLLQDQAAYVDHLIEVVESEQVDLVVVSGDVFDRALPPVDAVGLAGEAFARLAASRATTVVTSGNHDSAQRLGFNAGLAASAGVHIRTVASRCDQPVLLEDTHGPVAVYGIPYLDPEALRGPWGLGARSHQAALGEAMTRVRADLSGRAPGTRSVVMAHAFVSGAEPSESERDISVGGVQMVPTSTFDGAHYVALGHLHGRHEMSPTVRYSGSPVAYSFSEATHRKGSWLVDLDADGTAAVSFVDAPVRRPLRRLRGEIDDLLADPSLREAEEAWCHVTLTDATRPRGAMERLRRRFPHTLVLAFDPPTRVVTGVPAARLGAGRSDHDVTLDFLAEVRGSGADPAEAALLREAVESCCGGEADTLVGAEVAAGGA
ncbi:exonuclease SbcCD subunit D [Nocardioidaceae bacterium]|nr:exonuclease SbcCD subunit D [Nocardioidaceae bacterium]